jgi:aldehyde dehydrogenase (NAD+)
MLGRTLAPALAMGDAAVLKPAEDTSMPALRFAEIASSAGPPDGRSMSSRASEKKRAPR